MFLVQQNKPSFTISNDESGFVFINGIKWNIIQNYTEVEFEFFIWKSSLYVVDFSFKIYRIRSNGKDIYQSFL